jgi:hypothetical protein
MTQLGNVDEINAVKLRLTALQKKGMIREWELPYEHILTRLTAAVFFITASETGRLQDVWDELGAHNTLHFRRNEEKTISQLDWRVELF